MHQCIRPSFQLRFHDGQAAALSLAHNAAQAEAEEAAKLKAKRSAEQKAETQQQKETFCEPNKNRCVVISYLFLRGCQFEISCECCLLNQQPTDLCISSGSLGGEGQNHGDGRSRLHGGWMVTQLMPMQNFAHQICIYISVVKSDSNSYKCCLRMLQSKQEQ